MKEEQVFPGDEEGAKRIAYLVSGFLQGTLTEEEHNELDSWVEASDENMRLFEELTHEDFIKEAQLWKPKTGTEEALELVNERIGIKPRKKTAIIRRMLPYLLAASFIIALIVFWKTERSPKEGTKVAVAPPENDALPGTNKAVLTLANGQVVILDNQASGALAKEGGMEIKKTGEGALAYTGNMADTEILYHTISIPKGGQYRLVLEDGSRVWLNASSSLTYPVSFSGKERTVSLKGEAYFEIAKKQIENEKGEVEHLPFTVSNGGVKTEVLGTQFNVHSYDEAASKITLVEGSVRVKTSGLKEETKMLQPGQQAIAGNQKILIKKNADMAEATGWKNGLFVFRNAPIKEIGTQINRWYDVEVDYRENINFHFNATIERKENLSRLLELLEKTGRVHFSWEGRKLVVKA